MFRFLHRVQHDQGGAGLLYAALVMLLLAIFTLTVLDVGQAVHRKVQAQTAADTAAYTAASNHAKAMNILTFLNLVIVATYGAIALVWVFTTIGCIATLLVGCANMIEMSMELSKAMYKFAKMVNKVQGYFVTFAGPAIALESYRIAYRNLTDGKDFEWELDFVSLLEGTGDIVQHGALVVSGAPMIPPNLNNAVRPGEIRDLLHLVPGDRDKQPSASGKVKETVTTTKLCTMVVDTTVCAPKWIVDRAVCNDCYRYAYVNPGNPKVIFDEHRDTYCITDEVQYVVSRETTLTVERDLDPENPGPPMPYVLKRGAWQNALRFCAFAFRLEKKKAVTEKVFNKDEMLPVNVTVAEAETYDHDRRDGEEQLLDPDWEARMRPVSLQQRALDKLPRKWQDKIGKWIGYVIVH